MELTIEIQKLMSELTASINKLKNNGVKLAEAEKEYKMELTKEALKQKAEGIPSTLINTIVYGLENVAEKRLKRDIEQANYDANKEHINICKLKLRVLENQLAREWNNTGGI